MSIAAQDAIHAAMLATLQAAPALAGVAVVEDADYTTTPPEVDKTVAVWVEGSVPDTTYISGHPIDWQTTIRIDCVCRFDTRTAGSRPTWLLYADVFKALMANPTLGDLAMQVTPGQARVDRELASTTIGAINSVWLVRHRSAAASID
jgi:hypothetical protein